VRASQTQSLLGVVCCVWCACFAGVATPRAFGRVFGGGHVVFLLFLVLACVLGRIVNIYSCTHLLNRYRTNKISAIVQKMMCFSGLRGGVAFALSSAAKSIVPNRCDEESGQCFDATHTPRAVRTLLLASMLSLLLLSTGKLARSWRRRRSLSSC
jgi:NhaP-type Na+/H+ or K+/H+ antiporter